MKISLSPTIKQYWIDSDSYYSIQSFEKFIKYFFDDIYLTFSEMSDDPTTDGIIYDIQHNSETPPNKCNIMLCVENCNFWNHYAHHNKYKNYYNENIKIYLYNHIDIIEQTDKYIAIPQIYIQINYFQKFYNTIRPSLSINFHQKKFCLIATTINNELKSEIYKMLLSIDYCDSINDFPHLKNKSCYHSQELLNLFQQYKFIFICENSISEGYITEKIFNCYFSRTINGGTSFNSGPIYPNNDTSSYVVANIEGIDANTAWVGAFSKPLQAQGSIFRTTNGGTSWQNMTAPGMFTNTNAFCDFVTFVTPSIGVAVGDPVNGSFEIWRTVNGGTNFSLPRIGRTSSNPPSEVEVLVRTNRDRDRA